MWIECISVYSHLYRADIWQAHSHMLKTPDDPRSDYIIWPGFGEDKLIFQMCQLLIRSTRDEVVGVGLSGVGTNASLPLLIMSSTP